MNDMSANQPTEHELHAYVDGLLDDDAMTRVEEYLRDHPEAAAQVRAYLRQNEVLRAAAQAAPLPAPPTRTERLVRRLARRLGASEHRVPSVWSRAALLAVAFAAGWFGHTTVLPLITGPAYADELVQAHLITSTGPADVLPLSPERMQKLFAYIQEPVRLPDLGPLGFHAVGAQLIPSAEGAVLHVAYHGSDGSTMSYFLFHSPEEDEASLHVLHRKGVAMAYWQHDHSRYAIAASLSDEQISRIAQLIDSKPEFFDPTPE